MDEKFVIVEVLTSADYFAAAEALRSLAEDRQQYINENSFEDRAELVDMLSQMQAIRARADRFERVGKQVREQEAKTHGL